jgi:hypothetical protein
MPPIITIDACPTPVVADAHHSTHGLTTLLHNDQLILLEVQGTLEYNLSNPEGAGSIKLGDISWDDAVSKSSALADSDVVRIFTYRTSQDGGPTAVTQDASRRSDRQPKCCPIVIGKQTMGAPHNNTEETRIQHPS